MFMRAVLSEEAKVGLLLFDEPSAALDPAAEHGTPVSITPSILLGPDVNDRLVYPDTKAEGRENDDLFVPSVRAAHQTCRPYSVREVWRFIHTWGDLTRPSHCIGT